MCALFFRHRSPSLRRRSRPGLLPDAATEMVAIPDILNLEPRISVDSAAIHELLELAFLGKEAAKSLDRTLGELRGGGRGWGLDLFAEDLFVRDLIRDCFTVEIEGLRFPVNQAFLYSVLSDPPTETAAVRFRQQVLAELSGDDQVLAQTRRLYHGLTQLLSMFKSPDHATRLDINAFRLDLLKQARQVIDQMVGGFAEASSGLVRLHQVGREIQASGQYRLLADLLDYEANQSTLLVSLAVGADGQIKDLELHDVRENTDNRFYRAPLRRLLTRLRLVFFYGYRLSNKEIVNRLLRDVFLRIAPALASLVQLIGQLEFYLSGLAFRRRVEAQGLAMCLPELDGERPVELTQLFNPLLLEQEKSAVPCDLRSRHRYALTIITGPNSGGKTRLLQALGLAQLLGQSGLYVPATRANLPLVRGMFVSLVESETAHQAEGRLGRELMRIRSLFETMGSPSLVILDELCSGTNPAEGIDMFSLVLRLLDRLRTAAFVSTHFLGFARRLAEEEPVGSLEFLQVETDAEQASTYQFVPGVAETSLAAVTAERLGVTFNELAALIDRRREADGTAEDSGG